MDPSEYLYRLREGNERANAYLEVSRVARMHGCAYLLQIQDKT